MDAEKLDSDPLFDQAKIAGLPRTDVLIVYCSGGGATCPVAWVPTW